jgi:general secretion pathway protein G
MMNRRLRQPHYAFTLIEIMIVVIILGVLAAIIVPQFTSASHEARESTLKDCLRYLRTQMIVFKAQHRDVAPGFPNCDPSQTPDQATFISQMTLCSDELGNGSSVPTDVFHYGPYLSQMPANPINALPGIWVVNTAVTPAPDPSQPYGWIYNAQTMEIIPNVVGKDSGGMLYINY